MRHAHILSFVFSLMACGSADLYSSDESFSTSDTQLRRSKTDSLSAHTKWGLPDQASSSDEERYLSVKDGYVVSYNAKRKTPNWVSWELNTSYLGSAGRTDNYRADDTLPSDMTQADLSDYKHSGYDRGHLCPSADRTETRALNNETFYLTNMVPQAQNNNQGPWERLETYQRDLARAGKQLHIVAGGIYGGTATVGDNVAVPTMMFKVIVVLDDGTSDVTSSTRVIAVEIPNDDALVQKTDDWTQYIVSARQVEADSGFNFNNEVDDAIEDAIENRIDGQL